MNAARQTLRWAIPGWALFVFVFIFVGVRYLVVNGVFSGKVLTVSELIQEGSTAILIKEHLFSPGVVAAVAGAGLPVGFIIYQIYFWFYWRGLSFMRTWPEDRGAWILCGFETQPYEEMFGKALDCNPVRLRGERATRGVVRFRDFGSWLEPLSFFRRRSEARRLQRNWLLFSSIWRIKVLPNIDGSPRAESLADTFHALGVVRTSLLLASGVYVGYELATHVIKPLLISFEPINYAYYVVGLVANLANLLLFLFGWCMLTSARRSTLSTMLHLERDILAALPKILARRTCPNGLSREQCFPEES